MSHDETPLSTYGSGSRTADAALADGVVLKKAGPWAPGVIALLRHLEEAGFQGAPRVVGDGYAADGRLAVTYLPGSSPHPRAWPDETVGRVGELLRDLHHATSTFVPPSGAQWQDTMLRHLDGGERVFGHCDTGPWNVVAGAAGPQAFIDWEFAGPVDPLWELAATTWLNAQLHDDDIAEEHGLPDAATRARQAAAIVDGYGLSRAARSDFTDRLLDVAVHSARAEVLLHGVTACSTAAVAGDGYPVLWGSRGGHAALRGSPAIAGSCATPCSKGHRSCQGPRCADGTGAGCRGTGAGGTGRGASTESASAG
ncbi:aminoglycoside phosphotransferase family protein [Actinoplanes sp. NPDC049548]|uniref:aminoglycoside phosphotransferase family protein n=1 Tax=Actinoplanes sp. NPDC049548 TaxID=3155152 RepID=UPI003428B329